MTLRSQRKIERNNNIYRGELSLDKEQSETADVMIKHGSKSFGNRVLVGKSSNRKHFLNDFYSIIVIK